MNNQPKIKLIAMLKDMALVMSDVEQEENARLDMSSYIQTAYEHSCGTAACIMGYYAMSTSDSVDIDYLTELADSQTKDLNDLCMDLLGYVWLAESIWTGKSPWRECAAKSSKMFTEEELRSIHLNSDETTAKDAREYIELCINKIKEL